MAQALPRATASWSPTRRTAQRDPTQALWLAVCAALALVVTLRALNLLADALDPRR